MDNLKHGDEIRRIETNSRNGRLKLGQIYKFDKYKSKKEELSIIGDSGFYFASRFEKVGVENSKFIAPTDWKQLQDGMEFTAKIQSTPVGKGSISVKVQGQISTISIGKGRSGSSISSGRIKPRITIKHLGHKEVHSF